eukprot:TRINITY_DN1645_c1_g2_i2.p1 TRINITY_DN1645_c1_g2~~TRINITY_DN1645_c1_g2_i2.p1  ORF type:complete len:409 (-),score=111.69 TRINITY_DN1645_c1_g2_i2:323-1468(-)
MALKISIRPLKAEPFEVEVDGSATVEDLKKKISSVKSEFAPDQQKLIYSGRILTDAMIISDIGIKTGEFVVVMVAKAKAPAAAPAAEAAAAPAAAPAAQAAAPEASATPMSVEQASATVVTGQAAEGAVTQLMAMGFGREEVERCLSAAFGNPDRAVEYLFNGIPEGIRAEQQGGAPPAGGAPGGGDVPMPQATSPTAAGGGGGLGGTPFPAMGAATGGGGGGGGGADAARAEAAIAEMRAHPRFHEIATMIAQNPAMLAQILPVLQGQNPELVRVITQNPEVFTRAVQEAVQGGGAAPTNDPVALMLAAAQGGGAGGPGGGMPGGAPPGSRVVQLSPAEGEAIQRLQDLGFSREAAAQAYFACDKNEELAANFLFENGDD